MKTLTAHEFDFGIKEESPVFRYISLSELLSEYNKEKPVFDLIDDALNAVKKSFESENIL